MGCSRQSTRQLLDRGALAALLLASIVGVGAACRGGGSSPTAPIGGMSCLDRAVFGSPEDSPYILPYPVGTAYRVMQTYCGPLSHGGDNQLAYDFWMPIGEELVAARAGVVRDVIDRYEDQNVNPRELNQIYIEHADGSSAFYAHLMQNSAVVEVGDQVMAGELIGLSGETGTDVPHLHFGVYRTWPPRQDDDLPINFRNAEGPLDARGGLQVDVSYLALPY